MKKVSFVMCIISLLLLTVMTAGFAAKTKLVYWSYQENKSQVATEDWMLKSFNDSQSDIEVSRQYVPFADFKKQLSIGTIAGNLPDLVMMDNPDVAAYAQTGILADLTSQIANWPDSKSYFPGPWKSTMLNGKNYGIPFESNCLALFYNIDMMQKAGVKPPTTWAELRAAAKKLTQKDVFGFGISAVRSEEGTFQYLPWLLSTGASVDKLDSPEAIKSFTFLRDLVKDGSMPKEVINWTQADVEKQFAAGKIAMMINGPWNIPVIKSDGPNIKWGVVKIPKDKIYSSVLGGEDFAIINGKNVDSAWKFLQFIAQPNMVKQLTIKYNMFASRGDVANDPTWLSQLPMDKATASIFMDEMKYAMPRGPSPKWPQISDAMSTALQEVLTMTKSPEDAAKAAQVTASAAKTAN